jgi:hypothetical protein
LKNFEQKSRTPLPMVVESGVLIPEKIAEFFHECADFLTLMEFAIHFDFVV